MLFFLSQMFIIFSETFSEYNIQATNHSSCLSHANVFQSKCLPKLYTKSTLHNIKKKGYKSTLCVDILQFL